LFDSFLLEIREKTIEEEEEEEEHKNKKKSKNTTVRHNKKDISGPNAQSSSAFLRAFTLLKTTRQDNVCHQSPGRFGRRLRARDSKSGKESSVSVRVRAV
jgi:hypothetical protein